MLLIYPRTWPGLQRRKSGTLPGMRKAENMMIARELLEEALKLKPEDRFVLVEGLLKSLDEPDRILDDVWVEEAEKRLRAYREGRLDGVSMEDVFGKA